MALIPCRECGNPISSGTDRCPKCGKRRSRIEPWGCAIISAAIVVLGVLAFMK